MDTKETTYLGTTNAVRVEPKGLGMSDGYGSIPAAVADYVTVEEYGQGNFHRTVFTLDALPITTVDNGTAGHGGGGKIYDFPQGYICVSKGAIKASTVTCDGTGILADSTIDVGLGSVVATSVAATLSGTHEDILTHADLSFTGTTSLTNQFKAEVTQAGIDGSATAVDAYLNVAGTAADCDADGIVYVSGIIEVNWTNLGYADADDDGT